MEYALAIRDVHFEKGTLLEYCEVSMAEGPWPEKAYHDAARRERLRGAPQSIDYVLRRPPVVSNGVTPPQPCMAPVPQSTEPGGGGVQDANPAESTGAKATNEPLPVNQAEPPVASYSAAGMAVAGADVPAGRPRLGNCQPAALFRRLGVNRRFEPFFRPHRFPT